MYQPGDDQVIWNIKCNVKTFRDEEVEQAIADGWFASPEDFEKDEDEVRLSVFPPAVKDVAETMQEQLNEALRRAEEAEAALAQGDLGAMIRAACERQGIDKVGTMSVDTLIEKLKGASE
jgi:hypothetical protein